MIEPNLAILVLIDWLPIELLPIGFIGGILSRHLLGKISSEIEWAFQALDLYDFYLYEPLFSLVLLFLWFLSINLWCALNDWLILWCQHSWDHSYYNDALHAICLKKTWVLYLLLVDPRIDPKILTLLFSEKLKFFYV